MLISYVQIEWNLSEWKTGCFVRKNIVAGEAEIVYQSHMETLKSYATELPVRMVELQEWIWNEVTW